MSVVLVPQPWHRRALPLLLGVALVALAFVALRGREADAQTSTCGTDTHQPDYDPQVLVGTTPTRLPQLCGRRGVHIKNYGPNTIWCTTTGLAKWARVGNRSLGIPSGEGYGIDASDKNPIWCVAETAAQVDGAATVLTEMR